MAKKMKKNNCALFFVLFLVCGLVYVLNFIVVGDFFHVLVMVFYPILLGAALYYFRRGIGVEGHPVVQNMAKEVESIQNDMDKKTIHYNFLEYEILKAYKNNDTQKLIQIIEEKILKSHTL